MKISPIAFFSASKVISSVLLTWGKVILGKIES